MKDEDAGLFTEQQKKQVEGFAAPPHDDGGIGGAKGLLAKLAGAPQKLDEESEELRVMPVRFDEHGERHRQWREVCAGLQEDGFDDGWPVPGPRTVLWLCKTFSKAGLTPTQWVERFLSTAKWSDTDRSAHELRSLARYIETGGTYDQLNLASLASYEMMARRWQVIMEAHADDPTRPDYEAATYITGAYLEQAGVAPNLRSHVAKEMRDAAEVKKQLGKVRELKGEKPHGKAPPGRPQK